jgi:hypothetical protein
VPKANTRLEANMRISAVIEPEASEGISILRNGCESVRIKTRKDPSSL